MKIATAAFLVAAPSALAFAPGKTAFRPSTTLAATAATETKVRPAGLSNENPVSWSVLLSRFEGFRLMILEWNGCRTVPLC
jgi:hypothetical protein